MHAIQVENGDGGGGGAKNTKGNTKLLSTKVTF